MFSLVYQLLSWWTQPPAALPGAYQHWVLPGMLRSSRAEIKTGSLIWVEIGREVLKSKWCCKGFTRNARSCSYLAWSVSASGLVWQSGGVKPLCHKGQIQKVLSVFVILPGCIVSFSVALRGKETALGRCPAGCKSVQRALGGRKSVDVRSICLSSSAQALWNVLFNLGKTLFYFP